MSAKPASSTEASAAKSTAPKHTTHAERWRRWLAEGRSRRLVCTRRWVDIVGYATIAAAVVIAGAPVAVSEVGRLARSVRGELHDPVAVIVAANAGDYTEPYRPFLAGQLASPVVSAFVVRGCTRSGLAARRMVAAAVALGRRGSRWSACTAGSRLTCPFRSTDNQPFADPISRFAAVSR